MDPSFDVDVVVPAHDDDSTLGDVVAALRAESRPVRRVIVVDRGSGDATWRVAERAGAVCLSGGPGYGAACLAALDHLAATPAPPAAVVFFAADGSDSAEDIQRLLHPLREGLFDLAVGSRARTPGGLSVGDRVRNAFVLPAIHAVYGQEYSDLGPLRAIRYPALVALGMTERGDGWFAEMQVRAVTIGLRIAEIAVGSKPRAGASFATEMRGAVVGGVHALYQVLRHSTAR